MTLAFLAHEQGILVLPIAFVGIIIGITPSGKIEPAVYRTQHNERNQNRSQFWLRSLDNFSSIG
jgi:hypothetical protein